ncbi:MAG TPA: pantoate--beta-alanine ligase [Candidatus Angelobacter sp.]|nr:pantoate--beta-alanine ligase [Candidatus Angelobacter sp.]
MQVVTSVAAMQRLAKKWQRAGIKIALVPTMGYLHAGHLSLIKRARRLVGKKGQVAVSIYVNPTQFGPKEDLAHYPRDLKRDLKLCRCEGVDVVFVPGDEEMYPGRRESSSAKKSLGSTESRPTQNDFSTYVVEETLSRVMEGASRPGHFRGVTTVVAKLFNIVQPNVAVFGAKDFQQAAVIQRMTRDLNFPVKIDIASTFREPDGLAMSSRNKYLEGDLRRQGIVLWRAIQRAQALVKKSSIPAGRLRADLKKLIESQPTPKLDYVEFFDPETLNPVARVTRGTHMALAVFVGQARLIDNARL